MACSTNDLEWLYNRNKQKPTTGSLIGMNIKRVNGITILYLLLVSLTGQAQQKLYFEQLPAEVAPPHEAVNCILQDKKGFLWMGTWLGLLRYDGYTIKTYRHVTGNEFSLKSNKITTLFEDSRGQLWVGTLNGGLHRFDEKHEHFISYQSDSNNPNSLTNNSVWAIAEDKDGFLWVGTDYGLNRLDTERGAITAFFHNPQNAQSIGANLVRALCYSPDNSLWLGTDNGLSRLVMRSDGSVSYTQYSLIPDGAENVNNSYLQHNFVHKIVASHYEPHTLWVATMRGLKKVTYALDAPLATIDFLESNPANSFHLSHASVLDVLESAENELWIATFNGLNRFHTKTQGVNQFFPDGNQKGSINNTVVRSLHRDRTGILWIGTNSGLNKLNLNNNYIDRIDLQDNSEKNSPIISSVIPSSQPNQFWVSTDGDGINCIKLVGEERDRTKIHYTLAPLYNPELANFISGLALAKNGWLWIATKGAGVMRLPEKDLPTTSTTIRSLAQYHKGSAEHKLSDDYVMGILAAQNGVWMGFWSDGISWYDEKTDSVYAFRTAGNVKLDGYPCIHFLETIENGRSYIWVGTQGNGVLKLSVHPQNKTLQLIRHFHSEADGEAFISDKFINCLFQDSRGNVWVGTENGVNILQEGQQFHRYYTQKDGLADDVIQAISEDEQGNIWISSKSAITRLTFSGERVKVKNFDAKDGLQDNYFTDGDAVRASSGQLVFGGVNGLNIIHPNVIQMDTVPPQVILTDFRLFNKSIPIGRLSNGRTILDQNIATTSHIELSHRDNVISFEFAGLQLAQPQKNQYAYMLEGFDEDWIYTTANQRIAHYTNLPCRNFVFKVKAANSDGIWGEPTQLELIMHPPFWLTGWAYALYAGLVLLLLYGVRSLTLMRSNLRNKIKLEQLEREKLEEINQVKLQFFTNISHELRTPLTLIMSPVEQLLKDRSIDKRIFKTLTRIHHNANKLLIMINQLLDIRKSDAGLMDLHVAEGNLVDFLQEVALSFTTLARQQKIDFTFEPVQDEILLWYDRDNMEKVLYNLLSNAFKFTPDGGSIVLKSGITADKTAAYIEVADTGQGIPAEKLPYIFDRFYQAEHSRKKSPLQSGTGIGLSLVKAIVEKHHGTVSVTSEEDEGSCFTVLLPLGEAHFSAEEKLQEFRSSKDVRNYLLDEKEEEEVLVAPSGTISPHQILIVEDNMEIRSYLRENLQANYSIQEAKDGVEALEKALDNPPDLIISDIAMPNMDGIEFCRRIKTNVHTSHIPVILLTARTSLIFKIDGLETGADDYITKPFNMTLLMLRVKNLIHMREQLKEKFTRSFDLNPSEVTISSLDEQFLQDVLKALEKHMDDSEFSVEQLAQELHMSQMQLYRKSKGLLGKTPNALIRSIRLKRAAQLLQTRQFTVAEVTYQVGFQDLKYFRQRFKQQFGVSPSEYADSQPVEK